MCLQIKKLHNALIIVTIQDVLFTRQFHVVLAFFFLLYKCIKKSLTAL